MILNYDQFMKNIPTKKTFVLFGSKLSHSISYIIHKKIFSEYGLDADYIHVELEKDQLESAISHLKRYYSGANVTIPYKNDIIKFLDEVDESATRLHSVNTIKITNCKASGFNTDITGIYECLAADKISLKGKKVALLGYGGTANVVADILAKNCADFTILGRDLDKANILKSSTQSNYNDARINTGLLCDFSDDYDIIFNTTPIGMNDLEGFSPVAQIKNAKYVFDCIYNPQITKILDIATQNNIKTRNGLYMLYTQALYAENIWNNIDLSRSNNIYQELSYELFEKRLGDKNIVLFGFMGCGKTTLAKNLAKITSLSVIDTDEYIESNNNSTINEIFAKYGESHFRQLEFSCAKNLKSMKNKIISVGGGFLLNADIVELLKDNCVFVFLDTPFDTIMSRIENSKTRPLVKSENLSSLYKKRYPIYKSIPSITISNNTYVESISSEILRKL